MEFQVSDLFKSSLIDDDKTKENIDKKNKEKKEEMIKKQNDDVLQKMKRADEIRRIYKEETPPELKEKKVAVVIPIKHYNEFNDGMKEKLNPYISKLDKEKDKLRKQAKLSLKKAVNEVNDEERKSTKPEDNSSIFDIFSGGGSRKRSKRKNRKSKTRNNKNSKSTNKIKINPFNKFY